MVSNSGTMSIAVPPAPASPDLLQQHRDLEQVGHRRALGDHVMRQRRGAIVAVDRRGAGEDRELGRGPGRVLDVGRGERAARCRARARAAPRARPRAAPRTPRSTPARARSSPTTASWTSLFWRRSSAARWKPNTSTARRSAASRPSASSAAPCPRSDASIVARSAASSLAATYGASRACGRRGGVERRRARPPSPPAARRRRSAPGGTARRRGAGCRRRPRQRAPSNAAVGCTSRVDSDSSPPSAWTSAR